MKTIFLKIYCIFAPLINRGRVPQILINLIDYACKNQITKTR